MSIELLREMVSLILERETDIKHWNLARDIYSQLMNAIEGKTVSQLRMKIEGSAEGGLMLAHKTFKALGVTLPPQLKKIEFAIAIGLGIPGDPSTHADAGTAVLPNQLEFLPNGGVILGVQVREFSFKNYDMEPSISTSRSLYRLSNKKYSLDRFKNVVVSDILFARQTAFIHELTHMFDSFLRDDNMLKHMSKELLKGKYYDTQHEQNAYMTQAMEEVVESLKDEYGEDPTKQDALDFAPNAEAVWKKFESHIISNVKSQFSKKLMGKKYVVRKDIPDAKGTFVPNWVQTPDALRKKFAARVISMWDSFVETLPD